MSESTDTQSTLGKMKLCIEDDEGVRATYPLLHNEIKLGRDPDVNHICLAQRNISREHVVIYVQPESSSLIVQDLDSYTGIKVNGKRVFGRSQLRLGDYLNIGDYGVMLEVDGKDTLSRAAVQQRHEEEISILPQEHHARLVAVSNNLAGREYLLNRTEMMIGRDHDSDIPINHRSISQSHAKVIWSRGSFKIVDLSSTNGMKVNGEQFGSFNLTRGAVIQLGNVKLRYVEPGEQYQNKLLVDDDLYASDIDSSSSVKRWTLIALVFTVIFFMSRFMVMSLTEDSGAINQGGSQGITDGSTNRDGDTQGEGQGESQGESQGEGLGEGPDEGQSEDEGPDERGEAWSGAVGADAIPPSDRDLDPTNNNAREEGATERGATKGEGEADLPDQTANPDGESEDQSALSPKSPRPNTKPSSGSDQKSGSSASSSTSKTNTDGNNEVKTRNRAPTRANKPKTGAKSKRSQQ